MRGWPALVVVGLTACGFHPAGGGGDGGDGGDDDAAGIDGARPDGSSPDGAGTGRRRTITIDPDEVDGTHSDFPVWVEVVDPALGDRLQADASDLYFTDAGGAALAHELQRWVASEGRLEAWVKLPVVGDGAPTVFHLHYGDVGGVPDRPPATAVWQSGFAAVWHLEASPPATEPDATGAHAATASGGQNADDVVAAPLGLGLHFDGSNDQLSFDNPITGGGPHTISAWVDQRATSNNDALVVLGNGACQQARWLHTRYDFDAVGAGFYCNDWGTTGVSLEGDGWVLVHWTFDGGVSRLYVDGALAAGPFTHVVPPSTTGGAGYIGNAPAAFGGSMGLNATVDEIRIATVARSAGWIATEHANQAAPATFYTVGPEE